MSRSKLWTGLMLFILFRPEAARSQGGFNKHFNLPGMFAQTITASLVDNDTIVCYGTCIDSIHQKTGIFIAKLDTFGTLYYMTTHFDTMGRHLTAGSHANFVKTQDGGFAASGDYAIGLSSLLIKFDQIGNVEWIHQFDKGSLQVVYSRGLLNLESSFILWGLLEEGNHVNIFCRKIDISGHLVWYRTYGSTDDDDPFCLIKNNDNSYLLGATRQKRGTGIDQAGYWCQTWVFEIDSMGNMVKQFITDKSVNESGADAMYINNGIVTYASTVLNFNPPNSFVPLQNITMRRIEWSTGNIIWNKQHSELGYLSNWNDLKQIPGTNDWLAVGVFRQYPPGLVQSGFVGRISPDGDLLWTRRDTGLYAIDTVSENYLLSVDFLSSGSIVASGYTVLRDHPEQAWLIKIDQKGCMTNIDCGVTAINNPNPSFDRIIIFPNPSNDYIVVNNSFKQGQIRIVDSMGSTQFTSELILGDNEIDISEIPNGLYLVEIVGEGKKYVGSLIKM